MSNTASAIESLIDEIMAHGGLGFAAVAKMFPAHKGPQKSLNTATVFRWHARGIRGEDGTLVKLEAIRVGGKHISSALAVRRFISALSEPVASVAVPRSPAQRQRDSERASAELEAMGV